MAQRRPLVLVSGNVSELPASDTTPVDPVSIVALTAAYTLALSDAGKYLRINSASNLNLTIPLNATVAFPTGTVIQVRQVGAGQVTIVAAGGVTLNSAETLKLRKAGSTVSLIKVATDEWDVTGDLALSP